MIGIAVAPAILGLAQNSIAYFSRSGNTRNIAKLIHQELGGALHEIQPDAPYPKAYNAVVEGQSERSGRDTNRRYAQRSIISNPTTRSLSVRPIGGAR